VPELEAGIDWHGRMVQIVNENLHFYPADPSEKVITIKVLNDIFLWHKETTYHAGPMPTITIVAHSTGLIMNIESYLPNGWADRVVIKESAR